MSGDTSAGGPLLTTRALDVFELGSEGPQSHKRVQIGVNAATAGPTRERSVYVVGIYKNEPDGVRLIYVMHAEEAEAMAADLLRAAASVKRARPQPHQLDGEG